MSYAFGIDARIDALCKKIDLRFDSNEKAKDLARHDMERRLEGMNEFREQLTNQATTFLSRTEAQLQIEKLITRIVLLEKALNSRPPFQIDLSCTACGIIFISWIESRFLTG